MKQKLYMSLFISVLLTAVSCGGDSNPSNPQDSDPAELTFTPSIETVDSDPKSGHAIAIAIDQNGNPGISYVTYGSNDTLNFKIKNTGGWSSLTASLSSSYGYDITSSAAYTSGSFFILSSSYASGATPSGYVALFKKQSSALTNVSLPTGFGIGYFALAIDKNDDAHLAYYDSASKTLKYIKYDHAGAWSTPVTIDATSGAGMYPAITTDNNSCVHVVYYDSNNKTMKYSTNKSGSWASVTIADDINTKNSSYAYSNDDEKYWSIKADSNGYIHISYYNHSADSLYYATNSSGTWLKTLLDKDWKGRFNSIGVDSKNCIHISYYNQSTGSLRYITNKNKAWQIKDIDSPTVSTSHLGAGTALAVDSSDNIHIGYQDYSESNGSNLQKVKYVKLTF